jgi:hypothetical protein
VERSGEQISTDAVAFRDFESLSGSWNAVTLALNSLNRSMGMKDAYPFVLSTKVLEKLRFVHTLIQSRRAEQTPGSLRATGLRYSSDLTKGSSMRRIVFLAVAFAPVASLAADDFRLNSQEYFERPGVNVMYGQDYYPDGHQGGLSIIMHDERIASNGDVRLEPSPGQWSPIPKPGKREIDAGRQEIRVALAYPDAERDRKGFNPIVYPDLKLNYTVRAKPEGESIRVTVDFDAPIPREWVGKVGFNFELFPGLLFGKSYQLGKTEAVFQRQPSGPGEIPILAQGLKLEVAPETELYHLTIESIRGGELTLLDGRGNHNNGWFVVRALAPADATTGAIEWLVTPHAKAGLDANAGHPGVAGGLSPRAAEAGRHRAGSSRHETRPRDPGAHRRRREGEGGYPSQARGVGPFPALSIRAARLHRCERAGPLRRALR